MSRIDVEPRTLINALLTVKPGVSRGRVVQAYEGVRILSEDGVRLLTGSDDLFVSVPLDATATGSMDCVVSHADLIRAVKLFRGADRIQLAYADNELACSADGRMIALRTYRLEDLPPFPTADAKTVLTAQGATLAAALNRAARFAGLDQTRPVLCSVLLEWNDGPTFVGCDSYRLGMVGFDAKLKVRKLKDPEKNRVLIHRAIATVSTTLRKAALVTISSSDGYVFVTADQAHFAVRVPAGKYPNYRDLLPDGFEHQVHIPAADLRAAAAVAVGFSRRNAPARLTINGNVKLHGDTPDVCSFEEILSGAVVTEKRELFEIGFNPEFLQDIAVSATGETLTVQMRAPLRPALFTDDDDRYLLMPIRLNV